MVDDGHTGIHTSDSLAPFDELRKNTNGEITEESADIIMTNPPFGSKGKVKKRKILELYDLGHQWIKNKETGEFEKSKVMEGKKKGGGQVPDILFLERCIKLLKPGGRMGIVLPDGDLNNFSTEYVRSWLSTKVQIVAVVSLPSTAFDPYGAKGIKTSVLFLKKPKTEPKQDYPIFFANVENIGYDVSGKVVYRKNAKGEILDKIGVPIQYKQNGRKVSRKQDEELIEKFGAINNDIPEMLEQWDKFRSEYKSYVW